MVISYPIPPYSNPPIQPNYYAPQSFEIQNITLGKQTTITTTVNNDYFIGQLVRLTIPETFGCFQLNGQQAYVLSIPASNQVVLNLDSSQNVDSFVLASGGSRPQILAIGDINTGTVNSSGLVSVGTNVPGSFINVS